eukprot:PLAT3294.10.p1 GENE.PLAT3294.10~~PLAT3294.10.p1  ORF type:complete len:795 (+),score=388.83 PLAT3294.10:104-2488(+)
MSGSDSKVDYLSSGRVSPEPRPVATEVLPKTDSPGVPTPAARMDSGATTGSTTGATGDTASERKTEPAGASGGTERPDPLSPRASSGSAAGTALFSPVSASRGRGTATADGSSAASDGAPRGGRATGKRLLRPLATPASGKKQPTAAADGDADSKSSPTKQKGKKTKKKKKKRKRRLGGSASSPGGLAGYVSDPVRVTKDGLEQARALSEDKERLAAWLAEEETVEACKRRGVLPQELKELPYDYFKREPDRPTVLTPAAQRRRYVHYEERRMERLALVLAEREAVRVAHEAEAKEAEHEAALIRDEVARALKSEEARLARIRAAREKHNAVLKRENELLRARRSMFEERAEEMKKKQRRLELLRQKHREYARARGAERQQVIDRVRAAKSGLVSSTVEFIKEKAAVREAVLKQTMKAKEKEAKKKARIARAREAMRRKVKEDAKAAAAAKQAQVTAKMSIKEQHLQETRQKRARERTIRKEEKRMRDADRAARAARQRKELEYKRSRSLTKIARYWNRIEKRRELQEALAHERKERQKEELIERDRWRTETVLQRNILPGPGEYRVPSTVGNSAGGTWGRYNPKSDIDWLIMEAKDLPGPGQYDAVLPSTAGHTFSRYTPKSDLDWVLLRAAQIPGPGAYKPRELSRGGAVTIGEFSPPSELEMRMKRAAETPGPADYAVVDLSYKKKPRLRDLKQKLAVSAVSTWAEGRAKSREGGARSRAALSRTAPPGRRRRKKKLARAGDAGTAAAGSAGGEAAEGEAKVKYDADAGGDIGGDDAERGGVSAGLLGATA